MPWKLTSWMWRLVRDVIDEYQTDGVGDLAAAITFWTLVSIPAAALALVSALSSLESLVGASLAADVEGEVLAFVSDTFTDSEALSETIADLFDTPSRGVVTAAALAALFSLSRAFAGLIRALDIAYEVEEGRPFWHVRLVAIGFGFGTIVVVTAAAAVLAALPSIPLAGAGRVVTAVVTVTILIGWITTLFHLAPNHVTPWRYDVPGAVFVALGWILTSQAYALYVRIAVGTSDVQGSVGAVLLAFTLLYLFSLILIVGAELNDVLARRAGVVTRPRRPVRDAARTVAERVRTARSGSDD